jgi:hypothetical protein
MPLTSNCVGHDALTLETAAGWFRDLLQPALET